MKQDNVIASVSLDAKTKSNLEITAKKMGVSLSKLFKEAVGFYLSFDPAFRHTMQRLAKDLGVLSPFVIERLALVRLAEMAAEEELAGGPIPKALMEFIPGLPAQQFYDYWKNNKVRELELRCLSNTLTSDFSLSDAGKERLKKLQDEAKTRPKK